MTKDQLAEMRRLMVSLKRDVDTDGDLYRFWKEDFDPVWEKLYDLLTTAEAQQGEPLDSPVPIRTSPDAASSIEPKVPHCPPHEWEVESSGGTTPTNGGQGTYWARWRCKHCPQTMLTDEPGMRIPASALNRRGEL